LRAIAAILHS